MSWNDKKQPREEASIKSMVTLLHNYEMSQIPGKEELQDRYQLSDMFFHNMENIIKTQEKKSRRRNLRRSLAAVAAAAAALLVITQPQIIAIGKEWMVYWFQDHVSFQFAEDTDINWVPRYEFGYVPEGFELVIDDYYDISGYIHYENEQGNRFFLDYGEIGGGLNVDNENKDFIILTGIHGEKIYYLRAQNAGDDSSMTWIGTDGITKFNLISDLPEKDLLKLQENIRISEKEPDSNIKN